MGRPSDIAVSDDPSVPGDRQPCASDSPSPHARIERPVGMNWMTNNGPDTFLKSERAPDPMWVRALNSFRYWLILAFRALVPFAWFGAIALGFAITIETPEVKTDIPSPEAEGLAKYRVPYPLDKAFMIKAVNTCVARIRESVDRPVSIEGPCGRGGGFSGTRREGNLVKLTFLVGPGFAARDGLTEALAGSAVRVQCLVDQTASFVVDFDDQSSTWEVLKTLAQQRLCRYHEFPVR
jgi:hypothetical protein